MPELPEVETVRRGLEPVMVGQRVARLAVGRPDLRFPFPPDFAERVTGRMVRALDRRAKYLLAHLDSGEVLLMHLGMSGRFTIALPGGVSELLGTYEHDTGLGSPHDHVVFHLASGARVTYNDPRRFGFMDLIPEAELTVHKLLAEIGPEPLGNEFSAAVLAAAARGRRSDLKAFLLDQRVVAGLGNIYVAEALYRAGLRPSRRAGTLADRRGRPTPRAEALVAAIRAVLADAIAAGGSTLRDYRHADGALGYFQHAFQVYGRDGEPCLRPGCQGIVRRTVQAGRSSFHCRVCQI